MRNLKLIKVKCNDMNIFKVGDRVKMKIGTPEKPDMPARVIGFWIDAVGSKKINVKCRLESNIKNQKGEQEFWAQSDELEKI